MERKKIELRNASATIGKPNTIRLGRTRLYEEWRLTI